MSTYEGKRDYHMLDAELCMFASNLCVRLTRDLDDVSVFGIDSNSITNLKSLGDEFELFPSDDTYIGEMMLATQTKNQLAEQLRESIRNMALRLQLKWGTNSPQYRTLGDLAVSKASDDVLSLTAKRMILRLQGYLSDLESTGLQESDVDDFSELSESFEIALNNLTSAIELRDSKTRERIMKGNELYKFVVNYCEIGKRIYEKTDYAKYNDYVIYGSGTGSSDNGSGGGGSNAPAAPTNFRYDFAEMTIRWNSVSGATSYKLESTSDNVVWSVLYEGDATEFNTGEMLPEHTYLRIRSHSINGYSSYATLNLVYNLILNAPTNLTHVPALPGFTWNPVVNALVYEVQLRPESGTDDDYIQLFFGNSTQLLHADSQGTYYVRIRSVNNSGFSAWNLLAYSVAP